MRLDNFSPRQWDLRLLHKKLTSAHYTLRYQDQFYANFYQL